MKLLHLHSHLDPVLQLELHHSNLIFHQQHLRSHLVLPQLLAPFLSRSLKQFLLKLMLLKKTRMAKKEKMIQRRILPHTMALLK